MYISGLFLKHLGLKSSVGASPMLKISLKKVWKKAYSLRGEAMGVRCGSVFPHYAPFLFIGMVIYSLWYSMLEAYNLHFAFIGGHS